MPDLFDDVGGATSNTYLSLAAADLSMDGFMNAKKWQRLDEATRQRILMDGTRKIDRYKKWIPKQAPTQALAFPTQKDPTGGVLPQPVINALLEFCDFTAAGQMESLKRLQAEGVTNRSLMGQSSTFKADDSQLPAGARKELDKVWRSYSGAVVVAFSYRQMFHQSRTTRSAFEGDHARNIEGGPLAPL